MTEMNQAQNNLRGAIVALPTDDNNTSAPNLDPDTLILNLASRQHGVVARWQLRQLGVPLHRIDYHLKKGWFRMIHRGVYRVGPVAPQHHREMAAVLASANGAVVSHRSAGVLWDILPPPGRVAAIDVSTSDQIRRQRSGIKAHRVTALVPDEITLLNGLPITTPMRTLLDLASSLSTRGLEQAMARADRK
jgi:predicted transcriptional regulator of viral defense system